MSSLTELEAKVLGALSILEPLQSSTARQLCGEAKRSVESTRRALRTLLHKGFATNGSQRPSNWRATKHGRRVMRTPALQEYARRGEK